MVDNVLWLAIVNSQIQRIDNKLRTHVRCHRPTNDTAAEYVEYDRQSDTVQRATPAHRADARRPQRAAHRRGNSRQVPGQGGADRLLLDGHSNTEDMPRDMSFLFEKNRFNVAISRAQCLSIVVCSPELLEARCKTPQEILLASLLCEFVERAT